jgi:casein kinase II subunit alpha
MEIRHCMHDLLVGLRACHKLGIMHRDIKPKNVLVNRHTKQTRLIDFGLSKRYSKGHGSGCVGSRSYKSPELLAGCSDYDCAVDIWAAGCVLAGLVCKQEPFFSCTNDIKSELLSIISVTGSEELREWVHGSNQAAIPVASRELLNSLVEVNLPKTPWTEFLSTNNEPGHENTSEEANEARRRVIDLMSRMLAIDPSKRMSAEECLEHPYFDHVRVENTTETTTANPPPESADGLLI